MRLLVLYLAICCSFLPFVVATGEESGRETSILHCTTYALRSFGTAIKELHFVKRYTKKIVGSIFAETESFSFS